jgi:hypothetical protein
LANKNHPGELRGESGSGKKESDEAAEQFDVGSQFRDPSWERTADTLSRNTYRY